MIGIYKITNPIGLIYIGKSCDIAKRWGGYRAQKGKSQPKLSASFKLYGVENHKFEVICECEFFELHNKEGFYIDLYNSLVGLNCARVYQDGKMRTRKQKLNWHEYLKDQLLKNPLPISIKKAKELSRIARQKENWDKKCNMLQNYRLRKYLKVS